MSKEEVFDNTDSTIGCFAKKQLDTNELKNLSKEQEMEWKENTSNIQKDEIEFVQNNLNKCRNDKPNFQYEHVKNLRHEPLSNMSCQQKTFHKNHKKTVVTPIYDVDFLRKNRTTKETEDMGGKGRNMSNSKKICR